MKTLQQFEQGLVSIPTHIAWYLADLGEARGKQGLFIKQSPQKLKTLREHAMIESAVSSNRIEGIEVEQKRVKTLVFGKGILHDRSEEEVRGYRDALNLIHTKGANLAISEDTVTKLHRLCRGQIWDAGKYKEKDGDIIEKYPDGQVRTRFKTVSAFKTPEAMMSLVKLWDNSLKEQWVHPLIALAGFNLDFLCIHPFRDGNGRVSRLLLLLQCYHLGFEVGRYISLERCIEQNKERYYETLEACSQGWHDGKHNPWPYIGFILYILKTAYIEFERRITQMSSPRGTKTTMVKSAVDSFDTEFTLMELERACPGVSRDMIRKILKDLKKAGDIECQGRGPGAVWKKKG